MSHKNDICEKRKSKRERKINPKDIQLPKGYSIEVFASGLTAPVSLITAANGDMYLADSGAGDKNGKVYKYSGKHFELIADGFHAPLTGISFYNGDIYVSHRGVISILKPNGKVINILTGLPSYGDHYNNQVTFGNDGKMYFGQGTATNSGVVGEDNSHWVKKYPFFHDYPGNSICVNGLNYRTRNLFTPSIFEEAFTGAFSPFGTPISNTEQIKGVVKATGSILRANPDGSDLELVAWGLKNPFRIKFDKLNKLFAANHGMNARGSRPIENSPDEFQLIFQNVWYGWPDYSGGMPITNAIFKPKNYPQPQFLLAQHPMSPPKPFAAFPSHSGIMGFDFSPDENFGNAGDIFIAEFGNIGCKGKRAVPSPNVGHRVSKIDNNTGAVSVFAANKSGFPASYTNDGGFETPIDVMFSNKGSMFIVDFGVISDDNDYETGTGVIWRIKKHNKSC